MCVPLKLLHIIQIFIFASLVFLGCRIGKVLHHSV